MNAQLPVKGSIVWSRGRDYEGATTGTFRGCQMEGCRGTRIGVRWPDGKMTWPCTKGMILHENGIWEII